MREATCLLFIEESLGFLRALNLFDFLFSFCWMLTHPLKLCDERVVEPFLVLSFLNKPMVQRLVEPRNSYSDFRDIIHAMLWVKLIYKLGQGLQSFGRRGAVKDWLGGACRSRPHEQRER